jgi:hypothetical protein
VIGLWTYSTFWGKGSGDCGLVTWSTHHQYRNGNSQTSDQTRVVPLGAGDGVSLPRTGTENVELSTRFYTSGDKVIRTENVVGLARGSHSWRPLYLTTLPWASTWKVSWLLSGSGHSTDASTGEGGEDPHGLSSHEAEAPSIPPSPSFAPRGKPTVRLKLRHKVPSLRLTVPRNNAVAAIHDACTVRFWTLALSWLPLLIAASCRGL